MHPNWKKIKPDSCFSPYAYRYNCMPFSLTNAAPGLTLPLLKPGDAVLCFVRESLHSANTRLGTLHTESLIHV